MPLHASPTNAIQKVCAVLRALGGHAPLRLSELTVATGLNKVTALRILDTLIEEGFAVAPDQPGHGIGFDWQGLEAIRA